MSYHIVTDHRSMVFDFVRNELYQKAILDTITPDSIVLDLGAGLGLHGLMAAKAGAKKVYLVDPSSVILATKKIAIENGLSNIECIQSTAEDLELPEKVDVIISVFTGNFLLTEDLLPSLFKARDEFLKDDGVMIPDRARMHAAPVQMEDYFQQNINCWADPNTDESLQQQFGLNYQQISAFAANTLYYDSFNDIEKLLLSKPLELLDLNLLTATKAECFANESTQLLRSGTCHGWLGWFDARLGGNWLSTSPDVAKTHWRQIFLPLAEAVDVSTDDELTLNLKRPEFSDWTWASSVNGNRISRLSTFLSGPLKSGIATKKADGYIPQLNQKAAIIQYALKEFEQGRTLGAIQKKLLEQFPETFDDAKQVKRYVQSLVGQFSD